MTALLALALALAAAPPPAPEPAAAFAQLKTLVGTWRDADHPASPLRVRFHLTAGGTVLVESWERAAGGSHSLTLYHQDGDRLLATHYCPQGNQPRLSLARAGPSLTFHFSDATDLGPGEAHLHHLSFDLADPRRPVRTERYRQGAADEETVLRLARVERSGGTR